MSHTEPLTSARIPDPTDNSALYTHISNAVVDLSSKTVPRFTTNAARDTAYTNWVNAGNAMVDGLVCIVGGQPQLYRSGAWGRLGDVGKPRMRIFGSIGVAPATLFGIGPAGSMNISTGYGGDTYLAAIQDGIQVGAGIYSVTYNINVTNVGVNTNGRSYVDIVGSTNSSILSRIMMDSTGQYATNSTTLFLPAAQPVRFLMFLTISSSVTVGYNVDMVRMGDF